MLVLECRKVVKKYDEREILRGLNWKVNQGQRWGLIGRNGAGKTTLMRIIAGCDTPDSGQVQLNGAIRIGYLSQSLGRALPGKVDYNGQFLKTAGELNLKHISRWEPQRINALSGGERTKLALAEIWAQNPDLLLLDEPTNHMDLQGMEWLVDQLNKFKGTVIVISHDRFFLDQTVTKIAELEDGKLNCFTGNYTDYRQWKELLLRQQEKSYQEEQKRIAKVEAEITRLSAWSQQAHKNAAQTARRNGVHKGGREFYRSKAKKFDKRVKSKIKRLEQMMERAAEKPKTAPEICINFQYGRSRGKRIVEAHGITKHYGSLKLFEDSSFYLLHGEAAAVFGPNGCGKTTLARIILGEEQLTAGSLWISPTARIGYLSQNTGTVDCSLTVTKMLDLENKPYHHSQLSLLAGLGFGRLELNRQLSEFSSGELTKLRLAQLIMQECDLLLLDEPTNHLDLPAREEFEKALLQYSGTKLLISHDRYLLEKVCTTMLVFEDNTIRRFEGGLREYLHKKHTQTARSEKEELLLLETRIAALSGKLSRLKRDDPSYSQLDSQLLELLRRRNQLQK